MYVVSDASRSLMHVLPTVEDRERVKKNLEEAYPCLTFYRGRVDKYSGAVYWTVPEFPKGK